MNTPAHLIFGLAAFGDPARKAVTAAALAGALIPDASLYLMAGAHLLVLFRSAVIIALCSAALLHLGLDFLLHHDDGRAHFWPISNWIFQSPVSYWDSNHYGNIVGPIEILLSLAACAYLWRRFIGRWMRGLIVVLGAMQTLPFVIFSIMIAGQ